MTVHVGDCLDWLKSLPSDSVDALVTDPPAGIGFMGKAWDKDRGGRDAWIAWLAEVMREALRVLKPGAHGLVWSLPRTSHWTGTALEDAGFEVRDVIAHLFGSGFPKSLDVSKALDKAAGAERAVVGLRDVSRVLKGSGDLVSGVVRAGQIDVTAPATPEAQQWDGWGTALKPAREDWWLVRKPLSGTVAANVLAHGVGGLNVDGCRVGDEVRFNAAAGNTGQTPASLAPVNVTGYAGRTVTGRWPPHLLFSEHADERHGPDCWLGDAAKFFPRFKYQAKPSRRERGEGNRHPTVKPVELMRWLCRLITPPGGLLIDPFTGSGTTGVAAVLEGFQFAGCEREPEYAEIARQRIHQATKEPIQ